MPATFPALCYPKISRELGAHLSISASRPGGRCLQGGSPGLSERECGFVLEPVGLLECYVGFDFDMLGGHFRR